MSENFSHNDTPMSGNFKHDDEELERLRTAVHEAVTALDAHLPTAEHIEAAEAVTMAYHRRREELGIVERAVDVPMFYVDGVPCYFHVNYIEALRSFASKKIPHVDPALLKADLRQRRNIPAKSARSSKVK